MADTATTTTDAGSLLVNAITLMLDDPTFSLQSAPAVHNRSWHNILSSGCQITRILQLNSKKN